ncbi:transglycosylase family protein [Iamia majanohamensis]|uniref:Transglycosylase family protein n=1 Tax=Iamia majanohamensis TaxID=467976 RepID=A0AAE9Y4T7_9ACTN|nr:transglycosylase family protein [Iamia majanohamensis]WCO65191.1 transglycosylase family protein [Iamia majanohamensis]
MSLALAAALGPAAADQGSTDEATPTATVPVRQEVAAEAPTAPDLDRAQTEKGPSEHDKRVLVLTLVKQQQDAEAWFSAAVAHDAAEAARQQAAEEAAAQEAAEEAAEEAAPEPAPESDAPAPSGGGGGQWDALAQCESGGDWSINTGNGYYGGLQFSLSTWQGFGGSGMPHENSRSAQIAIAERVLASQGWGAWPSCSSQLGLR